MKNKITPLIYTLTSDQIYDHIINKSIDENDFIEWLANYTQEKEDAAYEEAYKRAY